RFLKTDGTAETGTLMVTFALYSAGTGGTAVWTETHPIALDASGFYAVALGSVTSFPKALWDGTSFFLGITIQSESELTPQEPIGNTGPQGSPGPQGIQGPVGMAGPQGPTGMAGPAGPIGATGAQGPIGMTGPQGPIGPAGAGADSGCPGPRIRGVCLLSYD